MVLLITFLLFFSLAYIIIYNNENYVPSIPISKVNMKPLNCCILLTMYIGDDIERKNIYENRVNRWLNETNFDIFVVDSSGKYLNQTSPRLHQFSFKQESEFAKINPSEYEKDSILKALDYFGNDILKYDMIFKITGKYFIPGLERKIKNIPSNAQIVLQNKTITHGQNTEIIGIRSDIINQIISQIIHKSFEETIYNIVKSKKYKCYRLPPLKLDNFVERGDGIILKKL